MELNDLFEEILEDEPLDLCDELRPAARGVFSQSNEELQDMFDPHADRASDYLWENH